MFQALFFDLDGTLVDSSIDITNALNFSIKDHGYPRFTTDETIGLIGDGLTRLIEKATPGLAQERRNEVLGRFLSFYSYHLVDNTVPYPFIKDTLNKLKSYKKAVVSNKREGLTRKILTRLDLIGYFEDVVGSDTFNEKKPSPLSIIRLLQKYEVPAKDALIIGDSVIDIETGINAGIKTVAVTYGYRPAQTLKKADFVISNMNELIELLK